MKSRTTDTMVIEEEKIMRIVKLNLTEKKFMLAYDGRKQKKNLMSFVKCQA